MEKSVGWVRGVGVSTASVSVTDKHNLRTGGMGYYDCAGPPFGEIGRYAIS